MENKSTNSFPSFSVGVWDDHTYSDGQRDIVKFSLCPQTEARNMGLREDKVGRLEEEAKRRKEKLQMLKRRCRGEEVHKEQQEEQEGEAGEKASHEEELPAPQVLFRWDCRTLLCCLYSSKTPNSLCYLTLLLALCYY